MNNNGMGNPNFGMNPGMDMHPNNNNNFENQTQPQMMSYKQFLFSLNSTNASGNKMTPEQSNKLYNDYKVKFRRDQTALFFETHKGEEWFKLRYHPSDSTKRKEEQRVTIKRRLESFQQLVETDTGASFSLEMSDEASRKRLFKFLDASMILLEGGTSKDLEILETIYDIDAKNLKDAKSESADKEEESETQIKSDDDDGVEPKITVKEESEETKTSNDEKSGVKKVPINVVTSVPSITQKTQSIFFKHLPVIVTRSDLEKVELLIILTFKYFYNWRVEIPHFKCSLQVSIQIYLIDS